MLLVDFDFYVPSIGYTLMFVISFSAGAFKAKERAVLIRSRWIAYIQKSIFLFTVVFISLLLGRYLTGSLRAYHHYRTAGEYYKKGQIEKTIDEMKTAMDLDPLNDAYYYDTAKKLYSVSDFGGAEYFYHKALQLSPLKPYYHYEYASVMLKNDRAAGRPVRAKEIIGEFKEALRLYPTNGRYREDAKRATEKLNTLSQ